MLSGPSLITAAVCMQLKLMTSWAVVCEVSFLPPQTRAKDETAQQFAERVQSLIAARANLKIAPWDGYLKVRWHCIFSTYFL